MIVEHLYNKIRYTLSNENLQEGDEVFPIARGRCLDNGGWILHNFRYDYLSEFPGEPHIIKELHYSSYKPYEVRTDKGFGPRESYFKIIKREQKVSRGEWEEIMNETVKK